MCSNFQLEAVRTWQLGQLEHTSQKHLAGAFDLYGCHGTSQLNHPLDVTMVTLDHYVYHPTTPIFPEMKLLHFAQNYSMPKDAGSEPKRHKMKVVSIRPYGSPDPTGPKYEQYCQQKLMLHKPFRHLAGPTKRTMRHICCSLH